LTGDDGTKTGHMTYQQAIALLPSATRLSNLTAFQISFDGDTKGVVGDNGGLIIAGIFGCVVIFTCCIIFICMGCCKGCFNSCCGKSKGTEEEDEEMK